MSFTIAYDNASMLISLSKEEAEAKLKEAAHLLAEVSVTPEDEFEQGEMEDNYFTALSEASENYIDEDGDIEEVEGVLFDILQKQTTLEEGQLLINSNSEDGDCTLVDFTLQHFLPFMTTTYCEGFSGCWDSKAGMEGNTYFLDEEGEFHTASKLAQVMLG